MYSGIIDPVQWSSILLVDLVRGPAAVRQAEQVYQQQEPLGGDLGVEQAHQEELVQQVGPEGQDPDEDGEG